MIVFAPLACRAAQIAAAVAAVELAKRCSPGVIDGLEKAACKTAKRIRKDLKRCRKAAAGTAAE